MVGQTRRFTTMQEKEEDWQIEIPVIVRKLIDKHPDLKPLIDFLLEKIAELEHAFFWYLKK